MVINKVKLFSVNDFYLEVWFLNGETSNYKVKV